MHKCNETKSSVSVSEGSISEQADTTSKTVLFRTTSEGGGEGGGKGKEKGRRNRKEGGRGLNKQKWTKEERVVLWECYVRSGGRGCLGYIKRVMEMWDGRDVGIRSQASILSQIKCIEEGGLLSEYEKCEIESRVTRECESGLVSDSEEIEVCNPAGREEDNIDFYVNRDEEFELDSYDSERFGGCRNVIVEIERLDCIVESGSPKILSDEEKKTLSRIREIFTGTEKAEIPSLKSRERRKVMKEVSLVNNMLHNVDVGEVNVSTLNRLIYAGSYVVCERLGLMKPKKNHLQSKKPWWQRRLEKSIVQWRKDLGRIEEIRKGVQLKEKVFRELDDRYKLGERGYRSVVTFLQNKVKAASFQNNQSQLYKELGSKGNYINETPNKTEATAFWSNIWAEEGDFNEDASWLREIEDYMSDVEKQDDISISEQDVKTGIGRMSNWKAPGPDGVRGFWFKKFTAVHPMLVKALGSCLENGDGSRSLPLSTQC